MRAESSKESSIKMKQRRFIAALALSVVFGMFGVDRFYLGYTGLGILKLVTGGGFLCWWVVDIALIAFRKIDDANGNTLI